MRLFSDASFWYAISFLLFLAIAGNPLRKKIKAGIGAYQGQIQDQTAEALQLLQDAQKRLKLAREQANALEETVASLEKSWAEKAKQRLLGLETEFAEQKQIRQRMLEHQIQSLREDAATDLRHSFADVISAKAEQLLQKQKPSEQQSVLTHKIASL